MDHLPGVFDSLIDSYLTRKEQRQPGKLSNFQKNWCFWTYQETMYKLSLHMCDRKRQTITAVLYTTERDCDSCGFKHCNGNEERGFGGHLKCRKNTFFNSDFVYKNFKVYSKEVETISLAPLVCNSILIEFKFNPEKILVIPFALIDNSIEIGFNSATFCAVFKVEDLAFVGALTTISYKFDRIETNLDLLYSRHIKYAQLDRMKRSLPDGQTFCHPDYYGESRRYKTTPDLYSDYTEVDFIWSDQTTPPPDVPNFVSFIRIINPVQDTILTTTEVIYLKQSFVHEKVLGFLESCQNVDIYQSDKQDLYVLKVVMCPFKIE